MPGLDHIFVEEGAGTTERRAPLWNSSARCEDGGCR